MLHIQECLMIVIMVGLKLDDVVRCFFSKETYMSTVCAHDVDDSDDEVGDIGNLDGIGDADDG